MEDSTGSILGPTMSWARTAFPKRPELIEPTIKQTGLTYVLWLLTCWYGDTAFIFRFELNAVFDATLEANNEYMIESDIKSII